ncbi:hypothetical protein K438DRAFT_2117276, partial [Mycena galopus ATCC 62051]
PFSFFPPSPNPASPDQAVKSLCEIWHPPPVSPPLPQAGVPSVPHTCFKFTQDKCYSNRAWAKLSGLSAREIGPQRCFRSV